MENSDMKFKFAFAHFLHSMSQAAKLSLELHDALPWWKFGDRRIHKTTAVMMAETARIGLQLFHGIEDDEKFGRSNDYRGLSN